MRLAYVTTYDPKDRFNWSGLGHAIMHALAEQEMDVHAIGPLLLDRGLPDRVKGQFYGRVLNRVYDRERTLAAGEAYARQIEAKLAGERYDVVFAPGSIAIARLDCRAPIAIWADATFASYLEQYGLATTLCAESIRDGHATERLAYSRATLLVFASDWAACSAIEHYGADPAKVRVVPFGANFQNPPSREIAITSVRARSEERCRLISIGNDWMRKGMDRAVVLATLLNERGVPTLLTIVGCRPPAGTLLPNFVTLSGFIDKREAEGERRLSALLLESHFHVLLSRAEAFGVVFAEANAHAVPNIATDVGGIASAVVNGAGGWRFDVGTSPADIATYIEVHFRDRESYLAMATRARREFDDRLNWTAVGATMRRHLDAMLDAHVPAESAL